MNKKKEDKIKKNVNIKKKNLLKTLIQSLSSR
jgi:hypothetical protein